MGNAVKKTNKTPITVVLHTHDEGFCTYVCKDEEVGWSVAARLVYENLHEFDTATMVVVGDKIVDESTGKQDGIECARLLLAGKYAEAVQLYNDRVAGSCESIEIDPDVYIQDTLDEIPKEELEEFVEKFQQLIEEETADVEEEAKGEDGDGEGDRTDEAPA